MKQRKPIHQQFIAAGAAMFKRANEWRDTLYYTGVAVGTAAAAVYGAPDAAVLPGTAIFMREMMRSSVWVNLSTDAMTRTRGALKPRNFMQLGYNSLAVGGAALGQVIATVEPTRASALEVGAAFLAAGVYVAQAHGSGLRDVVASYREVMWDHPRKRGGTTPRPSTLNL